MLLAWKNAHRFEASTFLLMDSVWAPLPSVSDSARNRAITAFSSAIFLLCPEACSTCSACSMLSCALMCSSRLDGLTIERTIPSPQGAKLHGIMRADGHGDRPPAAARYRCRY